MINLRCYLLLALMTAGGAFQPVLAASELAAQNPSVIYAGRVRPEPPAIPQRHILNESPGYHRYSPYRHEHSAADGRSGISARLYYQAPSTTIINRQVSVVTPQNASGDVYFNQDTYYLYPSGAGRYHPAQRYLPPVIPAEHSPGATENRAKQWTDKSDFNE